MGQESSQERTEPASAEKLRKARDEGQVAKSAELASALILATSVLVLLHLAPGLGRMFVDLLRTAAAQVVAWRGAGLPLTVSVNLSARQFYREDLAQRISAIVREEGCEPAWVELEVTETSLLHDLDAIRRVLHQLRDQGFRVAIDDFGTGYSSLTHLKHFPIDTLKIDISFIADLETDPGDAAITEAIIGLARGLGLKVVAEGVGTREQLEFLDARGCHCFQGFWISKPLPPERFVEFLRTGTL